MKTSKTHIQLRWKVGFDLTIPVTKQQTTHIATRVLVGACLLSLALGLVPLLRLLTSGP